MSGPEQAALEFDDLVREVLALLRDNDTDRALAGIDRLVQIDNTRAESYFLLGLTALEMNEIGRALEYFEKAAELDSECFEYAEALANLYAQAGRLSEGLFYAKLSTTLMPHPTIEGLLPLKFSNFFSSMKSAFPSKNYLKGLVNYRRRKLSEALRDFERELKINDENAECHRDMGDALSELGRYAQALPHLTKAAQLQPNDPETRFKLGNLCYHLGEFDEAILQHEAALKHDTDSIDLATAVLARTACLPSGYGEAINKFRQMLSDRLKNAPGLPPEAIRSLENRAASEEDPDRKLHIAYLSDRAHFGNQARLLDSFLQLHNRKEFEVTLYQQSSGSDSTTQRLRSFADYTRFVGDLDDELLSVIIAGDEVDVLIDLCSDDPGNRAAVLNMHAAKVQVGAWGTGMGLSIPGIDAVLTDDITDPVVRDELGPGQEAQKFDFSLFSYPPRESLPGVGISPMTRNGTPTIGIPCDAAAILGPQAAMLGEILTRLPNAKIIAGGSPFVDSEAFHRVKSRFQELNLGDRIEMSNHQKYADQMIVDPDYWQSIDVFIDVGRRANPANISDALWMGVPVLSLPGSRPFDRLGASVIYAAAKTDWIAETPEDMVRIATAILSDPPAMEKIRKTLRHDMRRALLFNPEPFVRSVERTYLRLLGRDAPTP